MARRPEQIIDLQVRAWEHRRITATRDEPDSKSWPVITISREFGALGAALAHVLGRRSGFTVWDQELVQAIAEESGGDERMMQTLDENCRRVVEDAVHSAIQHGRHTNLAYLRSLVRVVRTIATHGSAIIVGRGANYICDPATTFSIRVVSPLETRVRHLMAERHIGEQEALDLIEEMEGQRADFVRRNFRQDVTQASGYDLVLNSGLYPLEQLADIALTAYAMKWGRRPEAPVSEPETLRAS